jgi:hypothetical protein
VKAAAIMAEPLTFSDAGERLSLRCFSEEMIIVYS